MVDFIQRRLAKFEFFITIAQLEGNVSLKSLIYHCELIFVLVIIKHHHREIFEHDWDTLLYLNVIHESIHFEKAIDIGPIVKLSFGCKIIDIE